MSSLVPRYARNEFGGFTAREREKANYAIYGKNQPVDDHPKGKTEYDILRENLRFIREDENPAEVSYEERIARSYESKLFKEFALVDLKHYKTSRIALRWRTADEVVSGVGEDTCASLRCPYHSPDEYQRRGLEMPILQAFELPFAYMEGGERKNALVKVKVCPRCAKKLVYKKKDAEESTDGGRRTEGRDGDVSDEKETRERRLKSRTEDKRDRSSSPNRHRRHRDRHQS